MLNYIWAGMLIFGIGYSCFNGNLQAVGDALLESGGQAVTFSIGIIGVTAFWCGMLEILNQAGGIRFFSRILHRPIRKLFPESRQNPQISAQIVTNLTANFFGLGNGATPSGIAAVRELQKMQPGQDKTTASRGICLFLVINAAAFQLMPTTVLAIRTAAGSTHAFDIVVPIWIASAAALVTGIAVYYLWEGLLAKRSGRQRAGKERRKK